MAGKVIANTIVAGYPEPGVTADEIVGLVNRYGLPLVGYVGSVSKAYSANISGVARYLENSAPSIGPATCDESVTLEAWPVPSSILVSVHGVLYFSMAHPATGVDDNLVAGVDVMLDGSSVLPAIGSVGQSSLTGTNDVAAHGPYEAYYVDSIPPGSDHVITGRFYANGTKVVFDTESGGLVYAIVKVKVFRVVA